MRVESARLAEELSSPGTMSSSEELFGAASAILWSLHPSGLKLAAALGSKVCIVSADRETGKCTYTTVGICSAPSLAVTSIYWALFSPPASRSTGKQATAAAGAGDGGDDCCLLAGTASGFLYVLSPASGAALQRQRLNAGPLLRIRGRVGGMGIDPLDPLEDITVTSPDAIMRLRGIELLSVLRGHRAGGWTVADAPPLTVSKWTLPRNVGPRSDAFCAGVKPPGLYGVLSDHQEEAMLCIHSAGSMPALAGLDALEQAQDSLLGSASRLAQAFGSQVSKVTTSIGQVYKSASLSGIYSLAKATVAPSSSSGSLIGHQGLLPPEDADEEAQAGESCALWRSLSDPSRAAVSLLPSPSGGLLVATDQLGRVLLLDAPTFSVIRIWKGYRDAMCGWVDLPPSSSTPGASSGQQTKQQESLGRAAGAAVLCLVMYAPRKSVVEVWEVPAGVRRCAFRCAPGCRLLQPEPVFGSQASPDGTLLLGGRGAQTCFMLDNTQGLVDVAQHVLSASA